MVPVLNALPIDWTGVNVDNRTKGEVHDLSPQQELPYRIAVMEKGYFYTDGLHIVDNRGVVLAEDTDYQCLLMNRDISKKNGKTACAVIVITNPKIGNYLYIEAQMVGGQYCSLNQAIIEQAANVVRSSNRKVYWKNLTDKPSSFRANGHLHALWELFGFTPRTAAVHRMTTAMNKIASNEFDNLYNEFLLNFNQSNSEITDLNNRLATHIADKSNPHGFTKVQASLELVYNGSVATQAQAQTASGTVMNAYATPLRVKQSIDSNFLPSLTLHVGDRNNPHQDTAAKLGTMTTLQLQQKANQYYNRGAVVQATFGIGGAPLATHYAAVRSNLAANTLLTGTMTWPLFATSAPGAGMVLVPDRNGYLKWKSIQSILDIYQAKGNQILWAGGTQEYYTSPQSLGAIVGTNWPNGTICAVRYGKNYGIYSGGGGAIQTYVTTLGMAVIQNRVWGAPGWG